MMNEGQRSEQNKAWLHTATETQMGLEEKGLLNGCRTSILWLSHATVAPHSATASPVRLHGPDASPQPQPHLYGSMVRMP